MLYLCSIQILTGLVTFKIKGLNCSYSITQRDTFGTGFTTSRIKKHHRFTSSIDFESTISARVSFQGVKSLGGHFACLCRGFDFYEVKKYYYFSKRKGKYF